MIEKKMNKCIICNKNDLKNVINLGLHPPADSFLVDCGAEKAQKLYQLNCQLCVSCGHLQNQVMVPNNERYEDIDYSYTSSNSNISMNHWKEFYETVSLKTYLGENDSIVEFGSNDGYLTNLFDNKYNAIGIEPSKYLYNLSSQKGLKIINGYLSIETINRAVSLNGKYKLIYGNNVFNHISNLNQSTAAIKSGLRDDGYFVFESPYCIDVIGNHYFDTIYHEHLSYFSIKSIDYLFRSNGLYITDIERNSYHGGSIRVYSSPDKKKYETGLVEKYIADENELGIFDLATYKKFMNKIETDKFSTMQSILKMKEDGLSIAAVGAAARSNTLLNYYKLDSSIIDFITDSSEHKIGKFTPGSCIPILDDTALIQRNPDVAIILSWNIGKYLFEKIQSINPNMKVIAIGETELL
jgi:SAM-dependent methyltransferase